MSESPEERAKGVVEDFMHKPTHHSNPDMIWREHIASAIREAEEAAILRERERLIKRLEAIRVKTGGLGAGEWITVNRRDGLNGTKWAVVDHGLVLNKSGEWEYEPIPSSRDDEFLARCRFDSFDEAWKAAMERKPYEYIGAYAGIKQGPL